MEQQEIIRELRGFGGEVAVAAANEIETLAAQNTELDNSLNTLTQAYNKLLDHMPSWISVKDKLPEAEDEYGWVRCIVTVLDTVTNPFEEASEREFVSSALFDAHQKIWHVGREESGMALNALMDIEDSPLNDYSVTHWMPLPVAAGRNK